MPSYLFQPRGKDTGYAFRLAVPKDLRDRFGRRIVKGLGTDSASEAERQSAILRAKWIETFRKARLNVPLSLGEIEDAAREHYTAFLARMAADQAIWKLLNENERDVRSVLLNGAQRELAADDFASIRPEVEAVERRHGVSFDPASPTYATLARALLRAQIAALLGRLRLLDGMATEMPVNFLGKEGIDERTLKPKAVNRPLRFQGEPGAWSLFEQWISEAQPRPSTVTRWRAIFLDLQSRFGSREITEDNARKWAKELISPERTRQTVSDVWLTAARRIYKWAKEQKLVANNPFKEVSISVPDRAMLRSKAFTPAEVTTILRAAKGIEPGGNTFKGAQRWVPWLCAYSGARSGEVCQLRGQDILQEADVWIMRISPEAGTVKTKTFRDVPLHEDILDQGFLDFVKVRGDGPLFYNATVRKSADTTKPMRPRAVKTRERLAEWIRNLGVKDKGVNPTHGFRHLFKEIAGRPDSGISEKISDAITGHAPATVGRSYGQPSVADMAAALQKFPRYKI